MKGHVDFLQHTKSVFSKKSFNILSNLLVEIGSLRPALRQLGRLLLLELLEGGVSRLEQRAHLLGLGHLREELDLHRRLRLRHHAQDRLELVEPGLRFARRKRGSV